MTSTNTYYTKCGREFKKSTKADTTGYTIDLADKECANCPFQVDVKKGWPPVHDKWECRAGSKKPNHKNEWSGSIEDKNSIHIKSLDNNFLESIIEYCKDQSDLSASFNQDLADCRKTISVSCSSNKKGIAAKKDLVDKFFPENTIPNGESCHICANAEIFKKVNHGGSYGNCHKNNGNYPIYVPDSKCKDFKEKEQESNSKYGDKTCSNCGYEGLLEWNSNLCPVCRIGEDQNAKDERQTCQECGLLGEYNGQTYECKHVWNTGKTGTTMPTIKACEHFIEKGANKVKEECYACEHNPEGCKAYQFERCDIKHRQGINRYQFVREFEKYDIQCPTYKALAEEAMNTYGPKKEPSEIIPKEPESITEFDYSSVDNDTATFLQEKANKITEIRIKSVIALGQELKEAHDKLANHYQGSFGKWCESIGLSRDSGNNYIRAYSYVAENFGNIEDANNIQPSLLFAISKPSAPADLKKAVLSGDITSNKEYQEALKAKAEAEQQAQKAIEEKKHAEFEAREFERKYKARENVIESHKQALDEEKKRRYQLELDLKRAQEKGDPEEIKSLQHEIDNYQSQIGSLNTQMQELKNQMKDKPIEVSASKVVEKIPDEIMDSIYKKVADLYEGLVKLTETEIKIFIQSVSPDYFDDVTQRINDAIGVLDSMDTALIKEFQPCEEVAATTERKTAPCEDCQYSCWDGLSEKDENNGMVICTMYNSLVENEKGCRNFAER